MSDLDRLIAMVEAGDERAPGFAGRVFGDTLQTGDAVDVLVNGSLDAALRLHGALLPGWLWMVTAGEQMASVYENKERGLFFKADFDTPARAWFLAILHALKAKGEA